MVTRSRIRSVIVLLSTVFILSGCLSRMITQPTVAIQSVQVTGLNLNGATLTFSVEIENPNGFDVTVTALSYSIYLNDHPIAQGERNEPVRIQRRNVTGFPLPLKTAFLDLEKGLKSISGSGAGDYRIEGSIAVRTILGRAEFPFNRTGTINLHQLRFLQSQAGDFP